MRLILARHGNTFGPTDKVCWVGKRNDLSLVQEGFAQAERFGEAVSAVPLSKVYCAPLQRTRQFAETALAAARQNAALLEDPRLSELDYGDWSGLTDKEITERFGQQCLNDWTHHSIWPKACGWTSSASEVTREVEEFVDQVMKDNERNANVLIISSNGRLRYFLKLVAGEFDKRAKAGTLKVGTGCAGLLIADGNHFRLELWNQAPEALNAVLCGR